MATMITGKELRQMAKRNGVTLEELARAADLNVQTLYRLGDARQLSVKSSRKLLYGIEMLKLRNPMGLAH